MNAKILAIGLATALILGPPARATQYPQQLWTLPEGATFEAIAERPNGRWGVYWYPKQTPATPFGDNFSNLDGEGRVINTGHIPGDSFVGTSVEREDWNNSGQHVFLANCQGGDTHFLQLKAGGKYRALLNLPAFGAETLQCLRISPDGGVVYVLGRDKLWLVGAQTGKLLRIVRPRWGTHWSDENCVLAPDCETILGMHGKMTVFSARNGALLRHYGQRVETLDVHCGSYEARLFFAGNGKYAVASEQRNWNYETWVYGAAGGNLLWHGFTPYKVVENSTGDFFFDNAEEEVEKPAANVMRRWRDGKSGWHLGLTLGVPTDPSVAFMSFSRDGRWIYFAHGRSLWRSPVPQFVVDNLAKHRQLRQLHAKSRKIAV